jgi:hypothetical protein
MGILDGIKSTVAGIVNDYIREKLEIIIDKGIDKISTLVSTVLGLVFLAFSFLLFFLFATIALALLLGEYVGKHYWGFLIISALYLIIGVVFWKFRNSIFKKPLKKALQKSFDRV